MTTKFWLLAASTLLATTSLSAAQETQVTGVVTANISGEYGTFDGEDGDYWWGGDYRYGLGDLTGKVGVVVSPDLSVQFEGWFERYVGGYDGEDNWSTYSNEDANTSVGGAAHVTYHAGDFLIGAVGGFGHYWYNDWNTSYDYSYDEQSTYATFGIEGGYDSDDFRVIGQVGVSKAIAGEEAEEGDITPFAAIAATYYADPNLAITGTASIANEYEDDTEAGELDLRATIGAQLRYKLDESPVVLSLGYNATLWHSTDGNEYVYNSLSHTAKVGVSIPFGAGSGSLRDLDKATGLSLNDPNIGIR